VTKKPDVKYDNVVKYVEYDESAENAPPAHDLNLVAEHNHKC